MPYWNKDDPQTDVDGVIINAGDILERTDLNPSTAPWRYFICRVAYDPDKLEVRDCNAWNVYTCEVGRNGNVRNLGHYSKHPSVCKEEGIDEKDFRSRGIG